VKKKAAKTVRKRAPGRPARAEARSKKPAKPTPRARKPARVHTPEPVAAPLAPVEQADDVIVLEAPEPRFAARVLPPEPPLPLATSRRAIFFDVENASRPEHIARIIDHLEVDRAARRIDFVAVGNWRVIGHDTARLLARHGAHLIHSAPSVGVRDWSDLRIAVGAGVWLAGARPGDVLDIITSDRAFDAVGDVAAGLGITFRRLSHQTISGATETRAVREAPSDPRSRFRGRGRRRGPWRGDRPAPSSAPASAPREEPAAAAAAPPPPARAPEPEPPAVEAPSHTAPHDEIIAVVHDLMQRAPGRPVTLDSLANALKSRGFSRPPGSPRLITRLRRIKEITLSRAGVITVAGSRVGDVDAAEPVDAESVVVELIETPEPGPLDAEAEVVAVETTDERPGPGNEAVRAAASDDMDDGPQPGNERVPTGAAEAKPQPQDARRRRPRRGGRYRPRREPARAV
jgi:hypothetical protein